MGKLNGRVAVITGGASGIGEATVRLFVEEGAQVIIADIQEEAGKSLAKELGDAAQFQNTDVTRESAVEAAVARAVSEFGRLDVMYNNAGAFGEKGSVLDLTEAGFDTTIAVNLRSVFFGLKHAGRVLAEQGSGSIISTASIAGQIAGGGPHLYSTSKAGVIQLTRSTALELGERGVRVNCICPGGVTTPFIANAVGVPAEAQEGLFKAMASTQALDRAGLPIDIARTALWLASDDANYITGQAITVDGGEATGPKWSEQFVQ